MGAPPSTITTIPPDATAAPLTADLLTAIERCVDHVERRATRPAAVTAVTPRFLRDARPHGDAAALAIRASQPSAPPGLLAEALALDGLNLALTQLENALLDGGVDPDDAVAFEALIAAPLDQLRGPNNVDLPERGQPVNR